MKCPKCGYVGYQEVARCRNCGYDFSLVEEPAELPLPLRGDDALAPFTDLTLGRTPAPPDTSAPAAPSWTDDAFEAPAAPSVAGAERPSAPPAPRTALERPAAASDRGDESRAAGETPPSPEGEWLPLFGSADEPDDAPLVRGTLTPRAPLAVRRATADLQRTRTRTTRTVRRSSERSLLPVEEDRRAERPERTPRSAGPAREAAAEALPAGALARVAAALVDLLLVLAIDGAVLYFTLQIAGLRPDEWHIIPKGPFLAFLLLLDGGYLVTFTVAGGQTLGKMLTGLKVVGVAGPVDLGRSLARAAGCLVSLATAGLGFLPALVSSDGRAVHDRLAGTRVVREP